MNEKMIEAGARGILRSEIESYRESDVLLDEYIEWWRNGRSNPESCVHYSSIAVAFRRSEAAILAFLDAAMGDEGVVEKMARAMLADELKSKPRADFDAIWPEEDLIWLSNARAALAALKGDAP